MKISALNALATCLVAANAIQVWKRPTVEDAAINARTLIERESLTNINTVYQDGPDKGLPASFVEYYADCGDGNPVILAINMATSFKNVEEGSPYSLTVRVGDHAPHEHVNPKYPGSRPHSVAGSPRINLRGRFENVKEDEVEELQKCFLKRHKDAVWWLPGNPIHESHFVKFMVDEAYFLGGFGDTGYIGKIPKDLYHNASTIEDDKQETEHYVKEFKEEKPRSNWGYDAYMYQKTIKKSIGSLYKRIDDEIAFLKSLLDEAQEVQEAKEDSTEDNSKQLVQIMKRQLFKRDEQVPLNYETEDLSKDQIKKLVTELEALRSEVHEYGKSLLKKISSGEEEKKPEEWKGEHHRSEGGPKKEHHNYNKHHSAKGEGRPEEFKESKNCGGGKKKLLAKISKGLVPGDYSSEDIFKKNHPDAKHVPNFLKGQTVRVIDSADEKPGVYTGEDFYANKRVSEPIPDKVIIIEHDAAFADAKGPSKHWKGKHHKFDKHGGAKLFKGLIPGDYKSEDIFQKHHPDAEHVPEFLKGKIIRIVDDVDLKPGIYTGEEYYKSKKTSGSIPDKVYVMKHHKPGYEHYPEPKPDHAAHEVEEPGFFSDLFHALDFLKSPEHPEEEHLDPHPNRPAHHDFKQRRPKNVKFDKDLKHDFEGLTV